MSDFLKGHLENRALLVRELRAEMVGPDPAKKILASFDVMAEKEFFNEHFSDESGEEVLRDSPTMRYGAGVLYPAGVTEELLTADNELDDSPDIDIESDADVNVSVEITQKSKHMEDDTEQPVSLANAYRPSAIGLSFLVDLNLEPHGFLIEIVNVNRISRTQINIGFCGSYRKKKIDLISEKEGKEEKKERYVFVRNPLVNQEGRAPSCEVSHADLFRADGPIRVEPDGDLGLEIVIVSRKLDSLDENKRLVTASLVNRRGEEFGGTPERCIFQAGLRVSGLTENLSIHPYPRERPRIDYVDSGVSEEDINNLTYRNYHMFAIGHGCSGDWEGVKPSAVSMIWSDVVPTYEMSPLSADVEVLREDGVRESIRASMLKLANETDSPDWLTDVERIIDEYGNWIGRQRDYALAELARGHQSRTASDLLSKCDRCHRRLREGLEILKGNSENSNVIRRAFQLMNRAMLIAQIRRRMPDRKPLGLNERNIFQWDIPYEKSGVLSDVGYWRAFQIAFVVMSLKSIVEPESGDRDIVDLIWFPTGGGKTEAYLGLSAFTIFYNRLTQRRTAGVDVLMRYTLRLLTSQQFERAVLLFCAMESVRWEDASLGEKPFQVGLWVGSDTTPNSRKTAEQKYDLLKKDPRKENPFILRKCPWCGAKMGPHPVGNKYEPLGYKRQNGTVIFQCDDESCEFGSVRGLSKRRGKAFPAVIIDEDLYENPPNLLIGTVDKFAMVAWQPQIRKFFGVGPDGKHVGLPPSLIIQDELHLISGPLGTIVGSYETVIDALCRENGSGKIGPKIIASTATISHATEQVKGLYDRDEVFLFPPSGVEVDDSFFASADHGTPEAPKPGRLYVGVLGSSHGSLLTTQARLFASLAQAVGTLEQDSKYLDPWWTLLCFYNSIRELGGGCTLFESDVREHQIVVAQRKSLAGGKRKYRYLGYIEELTSRIRSDEIPEKLKLLERKLEDVRADDFDRKTHARNVIDACLASNIIEVGVDVDRLSLMTIVGQPKTTAQYIQVSSRVGRDPIKPGLVCTIYGPGKPRDRSHYEMFRQYHQTIYSFVEPTSVTPFSPPSSERTIHALLVAIVRQFGPVAGSARAPDPFPLEESSRLLQLSKNAILKRAHRVAPEEASRIEDLLATRIEQWRRWDLSEYGNPGSLPENRTLMHSAGSTLPKSWGRLSWPTLTSMRSVDADCEAGVTDFFHEGREETI